VEQEIAWAASLWMAAYNVWEALLELSQRIISRGAGGSWPQPGDPLRGQSAEILRAVAARAAEEAAALDRSGIGGVAIDTDGLTVDASAALIAQAAGWAAREES
jgi:hypothetical protein